MAEPAISNEPTEPTDEALLKRFQAGERAALEQLCRRHLDGAYRVALSLTRNAMDAEDAVQSAILHLLSRDSASRFEGRSSVKGWLMSIVVNACREQARSSIRRRDREHATPAGKPHEDRPEDAETRRIVREQVQALPEDFRLPIWMHYMERFTFREVGEVLGLSEDAAEKRVSRGLEKLRGTLAASGITATAVPGLLTALPLPSAPASLSSSLTGLMTKGGAVAAATAKPASTGWLASTPAKLAAALALTACAVGAALSLKSGTPPETSRAAEGNGSEKDPAGGESTSPKPATTGPTASASEYAVSPEHSVGWRGDGTGIFPADKPPLVWHRRVLGGPGLACQEKKPDGSKPSELERQTLSLTRWLVAGFWTAKEPKAGMAEVQIPEDKTSPTEGDRASDQIWKAAPRDGNRVRFAEIFGYDQTEAAKLWLYNGVKEVRIAYAHTWVYADRATPANIRCDPGDPGRMRTGAKIWCNGAVAADQSGGVGMWGEVTGKMELKEGWNSVLVKVWGYMPTWGFSAWIDIEPPVSAKYEEKNIRWCAPTLGSGRAQPVAVGGRILHCVEPFYINCYDAETGKLQWIRSFEYFGAMLPEWKKSPGKATPEQMAQAEKALQEIERLNAEIVSQYNAGQPLDKLLKERGTHEGTLGGLCGGGLMDTVDTERNNKMKGAWEQGQPTRALSPCSDGTNVYVFNQNAVAAAFTLDGKPLWKTAIAHPGNNHHGFACSPVLVGGVFIIKQFKHTAFDAKTGKVLWEGGGGLAHSSSTYAYADGQPVFVTNGGGFLRAVDGKPYAGNEEKSYFISAANAIVSPTRIADNLVGGFDAKGFAICQLGGGAVKQRVIPDASAWISTPVVSNGILFTMTGTDSDISAYDLETGKRLWRRQLEANVRQQAHGQPGTTANLIAAGKYIYSFDDFGTCNIFEAAREFKPVGRNALHSYGPYWGEGRGGPQVNNAFGSSPIIHRNRLYFQFAQHLWCVGEQ